MITRNRFAFAAAAACLPVLMCARPAHAQSINYLYDYTWAGNQGQRSMLFSMRVQKLPGAAPYGNCGAATTNWTSLGTPVSISHYCDTQGQHCDVVANVVFSHMTNFVKTDAVQAIATFRILKKADGTSFEGVNILALNGQTLASTGFDDSGNLNLLPIVSGALCICVPAP